MADNTTRLTAAEVVERLEAMDPWDPEATHGEADHLLLQVVPPEVAAAYDRLRRERAPWWGTA